MYTSGFQFQSSGPPSQNVPDLSLYETPNTVTSWWNESGVSYMRHPKWSGRGFMKTGIDNPWWIPGMGNMVLKDHCAAEPSSNPHQTHLIKYSGLLVNEMQVCLISVGTKLCKTVALQDTPLLYPIQNCLGWSATWEPQPLLLQTHRCAFNT